MAINSAFSSAIDSARGDSWHDADWRVDGDWHDVPDGRHDGWYAAHERSDDGFVHSMVKPGGRRTCASDRFPGSRYLARVSDSGKEILPSQSAQFPREMQHADNSTYAMWSVVIPVPARYQKVPLTICSCAWINNHSVDRLRPKQTH